MNFIIDQGNTFVKLAVFEQEMVDYKVVEEINEKIIDAFLSNHSIKQAIISSVKNEVATELLKKYNLLQLSPTTPLPLKINYKTPKTLGLDRISAIVGAKLKYPKNDILVIDMGTCITYDFIDNTSVYYGGSISPGFQMRFKALSHYTEKLPLITPDNERPSLIGDSTETAITSGIFNGLEGEINGIIQHYLKQYPALKIVVTGGDANRFDLEPKNRIFADEFLVLNGLNEILNYNDKVN